MGHFCWRHQSQTNDLIASLQLVNLKTMRSLFETIKIQNEIKLDTLLDFHKCVSAHCIFTLYEKNNWAASKGYSSNHGTLFANLPTSKGTSVLVLTAEAVRSLDSQWLKLRRCISPRIHFLPTISARLMAAKLEGAKSSCTDLAYWKRLHPTDHGSEPIILP